MTTNNEDVAAAIAALEREADRIRHDAARRVYALEAAIWVLKGERPRRTSGEASVTEMIEAAARACAKTHPVLDHRPTYQKAVEMYPEKAHKLRTGVYPAFKKLIARGVMKRVPGGFALTDGGAS